jgi:hypothetical protein
MIVAFGSSVRIAVWKSRRSDNHQRIKPRTAVQAEERPVSQRSATQSIKRSKAALFMRFQGIAVKLFAESPEP